MSCVDIEQRISLDFLQCFFFYSEFYITFTLLLCLPSELSIYIQQSTVYLCRMQQKQKKMFHSSLVISKIWDFDHIAVFIPIIYKTCFNTLFF